MPRIPLNPPEPKPRPPLKKEPRNPPLFDRLAACQWRGIGFPASSIKVSLSQDLAEHKYWGQEAASVEATGRAPLQIEATIPFVNHIVPGKNERWSVLYPQTFLEFLHAFVDKSTGILDTPEIQGIACKPVSLDYAHEGTRRDGVEVTARWVETVDPDLDASFVVKSASDDPVDVVLSLDASDADIRALADEFLPPTAGDMTFDQFVNKVSGFFGKIATSAELASATPARLLQQLKRMKRSVERARNALTHPIVNSMSLMETVLRSNTVNGTGPTKPPPPPGKRKVARHVTKGRTSLPLLARDLKNTTDELIKLNPQLLSRPQVAEGAVVVYYA